MNSLKYEVKIDKTNKIIYDWLSFTNKTYKPTEIIVLLGLEEIAWDTVKGAKGYKDRLYFDGISIHYNGNPGQGVWCEMSGQGCRAFETYSSHGSFDYLFDVITNNSLYNITRLDIAFDDFEEILDIKKVADDTLKQNYISRSTSWEVRQSNKGATVNIGSCKSDVQIRIYDKAKERGHDDFNWTRVELQLSDDRAFQYIKLKEDTGEKFYSVLHNYLRYVIPEPDTNKSRWQMTDYWYTLLNNARKLSIYNKPGIEYNIFKCKDFVVNNCGNAISALVECVGSEQVLDWVKHRKCAPNPKYEEIIKQYKHFSKYFEDEKESD